MGNVLGFWAFLIVSAGAFFVMDRLFGVLGVKGAKAKNICTFGGVVLLIVAFGLIFGFEGGYTVPDWSERARR